MFLETFSSEMSIGSQNTEKNSEYIEGSNVSLCEKSSFLTWQTFFLEKFHMIISDNLLEQTALLLVYSSELHMLKYSLGLMKVNFL